jgi:hypothetical protein
MKLREFHAASVLPLLSDALQIEVVMHVYATSLRTALHGSSAIAQAGRVSLLTLDNSAPCHTPP